MPDRLAIEHVAVMRAMQDSLGAVEQHPETRPRKRFHVGAEVSKQRFHIPPVNILPLTGWQKIVRTSCSCLWLKGVLSALVRYRFRAASLCQPTPRLLQPAICRDQPLRVVVRSGHCRSPVISQRQLCGAILIRPIRPKAVLPALYSKAVIPPTDFPKAAARLAEQISPSERP